MRAIAWIVICFFACFLFKCHAQDMQPWANGYAADMAKRVVDNKLPQVHGQIKVDAKLKQKTYFDLNDKGLCTILINPVYMKTPANSTEVFFAISIQYAHCVYNDPHTNTDETDAWFRVYRADAFANKLYRVEGLEAYCLNEPDSFYSPSCERRVKARLTGIPTYRVEERSQG